MTLITFLRLFLVVSLFPIFLQSQSLTVSGDQQATNMDAATATVVAPNLVITSGGTITDFTVSITNSFTASDALGYNGPLPSGVTTTGWNPATRSIVFKGTRTAEQWQSFLRTVTMTSGPLCSPETRQVTFVAEETFYNPLNGHFYRTTSTPKSWTDTKVDATSTSFFGREAYLVTLTSNAENIFVTRLVGQDSWMGASDDHNQINEALGYQLYADTNASEGKFYWVTGPEKGTQITTANGNGNAVAGVFQNWRNGEPNDYNNGNPGESFGHVYAQQGDWNDFPNSSLIRGIIEFGGMPNDLTLSTPFFTKDIMINGAPGGEITGGNVTVCAGTSSTTLTLSGLNGSVVRWESSDNNFIDTPTVINSTSTSLTVNNISTTTYYRAVVNTNAPSSCSGLVTSSAPIFVSVVNPGNVFAENTTICANSNVELFISGQQGTVERWQRSINNSTWEDIADSAANTFSEPVPSEGTRYYRAMVGIAGCGVAVPSPSKEITIVSGVAPVGGSVSSAVHGSTTNSGTLTLSGHTGTISKWQRSTDNGIIWTDIAHTTASYAYSNVTTETLFRAVLTNGSCGTANSTPGSVSIASPPSITSFTPDLAGNGQTVTLTGSGFTWASSVQFGDTEAISFTVVSDTEITAVVGTGASGAITVVGPGGSDTAAGFTYLVAQYDFEGNPLDGTDNNYDGVTVNTVTYGTGAQGQAVCFDNGPGFIRLPDGLISALSEFTISLRFKTTGTGAILGYQNVAAATSNSPSNWIPILMVTNDGKLKGTLWTSASISIQAISTNVVNDGNWHQVDFTAGTNSVTIYVDGVIQATQSGASVAHLDMDFNQLGFAFTNGYNQAPTTWEYFQGCLDDLLIIDRALTQTELEAVTELPEPTITNFDPSNASNGNTVTITGTNFEGATQVTFGGVGAASFTVDSATQITAVLASGASGDVTVTTAGGTATSNGFTYIVPNTAPTVTSASITSATAQSLYYYDIKASDAENDVITWTANTVPAWLTFTSGTLQSSFVGTGATPTNTGDGVNQSADGTTASSAVIQTNSAAHGDDKLFFTDTEEYGIRYVDESGNVQTWYQGDGTYTNLNPVGIAYDVANDAVYVGDYAKSDIVKIDNTGTRTLLSNLPEAFMFRLLVNSDGSKLYASARGGIYEIDLANANPDTNWTRVVGTGTMGYSDTGTASTSQVNQPHGMAFDSAGRLVFTDRFNDIIRRVNLDTDTIETIAGTQGAGAEAGDGGPAVNGTFNDPSGLVINEHDEIFISERLSKRIRKIDINGDIDTFFTVSAGGFADDLVISDAGELYLLTTTLVAQVATKAVLTGTPTNADAGVHDVALTLSDGIFNIPYNFQITVQAINIAPTDITLDNNTIGESTIGVDSTVGTLSTTDADSGDSHTYSLVSGTGDTDNPSFNISGNTLRTNSSLGVGSYSVRINTNDGTDDFSEEFTVEVSDDVAPQGYTATIDQDFINASNQASVSFTFAGAEIGADYVYTFSSDGGGTNITGSGTIATATDQITDIDLSGLDDGNITMSVTLTDTNGNEGGATTDSKTKDVVEPVPNLVIAESLYFGPFTIRLQFSEPVLDLAPNPVLIAPGPGGEQMATLGPLQEVTAGLLYDIQVTPLVPGEIVFYNDLYGMARDEARNYTIPLGFVTGTYYDLDTDNDGIGNSTDTDDDNDGTPDTEDDFPLDENEDTDTDGDGTGDNADDDDDNDGTPDSEDDFPKDPSEDTDTDRDGTGDNTDDDDDNDGTPDSEDAFPKDASEDTDTDGDGTGDNADDDDDGDGTPDTEDAFPLDENEDTDTDGDGIGNNADDDDDGDGTPDMEDAFPLDENEDTDIDGDGIGNNMDEDDDGDGIPDTEDADSDQLDTDGDGIPDTEDEDDDNDGTPDSEDDFPLNPDEDTDTDGDGTGDNADDDDDGDGIPDTEDSDSDELDTDGDGIPDAEDDDDDNDGVLDNEDSFPLESTPILIPAKAFTPNGDGNNDTWVIPGIDNYPNSTVRVYNRWGHEVFAAQGYQNDWEGFFQDNREKLPPGSYLYILDLGNGAVPQQGWIFINY